MDVLLTTAATGETTEQSAKRMGIAFATARTHWANILMKLGVHSRVEAVTKVWVEGWLRLGEQKEIVVRDDELVKVHKIKSGDEGRKIEVWVKGHYGVMTVKYNAGEEDTTYVRLEKVGGDEG